VRNYCKSSKYVLEKVGETSYGLLVLCSQKSFPTTVSYCTRSSSLERDYIEYLTRHHPPRRPPTHAWHGILIWRLGGRFGMDEKTLSLPAGRCGWWWWFKATTGRLEISYIMLSHMVPVDLCRRSIASPPSHIQHRIASFPHSTSHRLLPTFKLSDY
jgi:hypothetical protein